MKKRKNKKYLDQIDISSILEQRARFEKRIIELGGTIPKPSPWPDRSGTLRNLQLLERVEQLERKQCALRSRERHRAQRVSQRASQKEAGSDNGGVKIPSSDSLCNGERADGANQESERPA